MVCITSEGPDVFFTQLCREANTVTQLSKTPAYWLITAQLWPAPDTTFPLCSSSQFTQGLLRVIPLFLCCICRTSWPVQQLQSSSRPKLFSISAPFLLRTHSKKIKHYCDIWNLKLHAFICMWKTDYESLFSFNIFPGVLLN